MFLASVRQTRKRAAIQKGRQPIAKPCIRCGSDPQHLTAGAPGLQPVNQRTRGCVLPQYRRVAIEPVRHFAHAVAVVIVLRKEHIEQGSFAQVVPLFEESLAHLIGFSGEAFVLLRAVEP
ncbi:hypothetical protein OKW38_007199 [Paraburkholderia sp. MM5496-R1]